MDATAMDDYLIYSDFPFIRDSTATLNDLRRALGRHKLHGFITERHLRVWVDARLAFEESPRKFGYNATDNLVWSLLITFIIRDHFDQSETIIGYMRERGIFSTDDLAALMTAGGSTAALADGVL
jgi:hypothetical protein